MSRFKNTKRESFLSNIPTASISDKSDTLTAGCKFNFKYYDSSQDAGQRYEDWTNDQLVKLLNKLKHYCEKPLQHWQTQPIGKKSQHVLEIYGDFPRKSDFEHPKHVPHQARWARFRMESSVRLIGFVLPDEVNGKIHEGTEMRFDCNTFYVVFLDKDHRFYKTK